MEQCCVLRKWQDLGVRYGDLEEVMNEVYEEIIALYPSEKLASLVQTALETDIVIPQQQYHHVTLNEYKEATDWKDKLRMLKEFPTPTLQDIDLLDEALQEDKSTPKTTSYSINRHD